FRADSPSCPHELIACRREHEVTVRRRVSKEPPTRTIVEAANNDALFRLSLAIEDHRVRLDCRLALRLLDEPRALHRIDFGLVNRGWRSLPFAFRHPRAVHPGRMFCREPA